MKVQSYQAGKLGQSEYDSTAFGGAVLFRTLKDAVVMYQANQRQGTVKTKTRSEVHGSHKKPWKQKHTGRARAGDKKSPIWRSGGTVFGPRPRDYSYHMPQKARQVALRSALAGKIKDQELVIADHARGATPSSKNARAILAAVGSPRRALIVLATPDTNVWKSFRNFPGVVVKSASEINALDVVNGGIIIAERGALTALEARVGKKTKEGVA